MSKTAASLQLQDLLNTLSGQLVDIQPLVTEASKEYLRTECCQQLLPRFWESIREYESPRETLLCFLSAVRQLSADWEHLLHSMPCAEQLDPPGQMCLLDVFHTCLSISQPPFVFSLVEQVCEQSLQEWKKRDDEGTDVSMEAEECESYWEEFVSLTADLQSLKLCHFFIDFAIAEVVRREVKLVVTKECSQEYDSPMIASLLVSLRQRIVTWIKQIFNRANDIDGYWLSQVDYLGHKIFAELRISELFDILVDYPDSEPALIDLKISLSKVDLRSQLISSLKAVFEQRLLHPGANTSDIITQYISAIKGLRLLDPSGVVLEQVCDPVRSYLRTREDTVRCIVASLIDDGSNELADELVVGEPVLVDLNEESDGEDVNFDSWEPDPIDADPNKTSKSRQTSDIISLLVNIYGSRELFVNEYRNLLADRLLQTLGYNTSREVRNLELLKLRFGESNLHFCEVMIKDIADSKRINTYIHTKRKRAEQKEEGLTEPTGGPEINAFILSHVFWPNFREEKLKLPEFAQRELDEYCEAYKTLKGMRTLEWKPHLGLVEVELELEDRNLSLCVSPFRAAIIHQFGEQSRWTVDGLCSVLEAQPSAVRRHIGFWVGQGVLKEKPTDTFTVVEQEQHGSKGVVEDEEESAMVSAEDQKESEYQVFWAYIVGMLTSLGKMKLDRIYSMLRMFAMQGEEGKDCSQAELKSFLDRKVKEQTLSVSAGEYHLPH